jgi:hypothetical protein
MKNKSIPTIGEIRYIKEGCVFPEKSSQKTPQERIFDLEEKIKELEDRIFHIEMRQDNYESQN